MTNYEYYKTYSEAYAAYWKYRNFFSDYMNRNPSYYPSQVKASAEIEMGKWLFNAADTACDRKFTVNGLVQNVNTGDYFYLENLSFESPGSGQNEFVLNRICLIGTGGGRTAYDTRDFRPADIPQQFIEVIKAQMQTKCPLKEVACG